MARLASHEKGDNNDEVAPSSELWTLHEEAQGVGPSCQFVPLARRHTSSSLYTSNSKATPPTAVPPRDRAGSYDTVGHEEVWSAGSGGGAPEGGGCLVNSEGLPVLLRRWTFTEPTLLSKRRCVDTDGCGIGGGVGRGGLHHRTGDTGGSVGGGAWGRVPMSVSEDNMLSLLSKRSCQALEDGGAVGVPPPPTPTTTPNKLPEREVTTGSSVSNSSGSSISSGADSEGAGGTTGTAPMQQPQDEEQAHSAAERALLQMRLHRLGLVQDTSRCVMDIVEGRTAAATETASVVATMPVGCGTSARPAVTLEEVKEHVWSLPERYALSVDPQEALTHMALIADITSDASSAGTSSAGSTTSSVRVLVKRGSGGGNGGGGGGHGTGDKGRGRYTLTVACRYSPFLLGAVSSSLRSSGAACLDADVMTTTPNVGDGSRMSLARLEVEIACGRKADLSDPTGAAAAAAAAAAAEAATVTATGAVSPPRERSRAEEEDEEEVDGPAAPSCLARLLSSSIAAKIRAAEREENGGWQQEEMVQEEGRAEEDGQKEVHGGSARGDDHPRAAQWCAMNARVGVVAKAEAGKAQRQSEAPASCCGASSTHREVRREPLARRQGCFFLAEADANTLGYGGSSDASSFSRGGGGGGDVGSVANPFSSKSNDAGASPNVSNGGNNVDINGDFSNRDSGSFPQWTGSASNNSNNPATSTTTTSTTTRNNSPNVDHGGSSYPTIPTEDIELLELAGKGRFSRTYRAKLRGATVAVKALELPPETDAAASVESERSVIVAEFERELHIVRKLRHPNVCGFRGVCVASPHHICLVYDFLANGTLGDRLRDTGWNVGGEDRLRPQPLRSADLVRIVKDVVDGMLYLHEHGVLHRDVKPDNILLDADDRAVIADFGLSRLCQPTNDHTAETGTYRWMAPEVIRHEPYSHAADVYSFGVVLWQVLTRRQPFEGLTPIQAAFSVARQGLRPPLPPSAPSALSSMIGRCWHPNPNARPSFTQIRSELPEIERQMLSL